MAGENGEAPSEAPPDIPERSYTDVLSGRIRFTLADKAIVMPVLTRKQNREWLENLTVAFAPIVDSADDETTEQVIEKLVAVDDRLLDFVYDYDLMGVLPARGDWEDDIYPHQIIRAVLEVRVAANPTLGYALAGLSEDVAETRRVQEALRTAQTSQTSSSRRRTGASRSRRSTN